MPFRNDYIMRLIEQLGVAISQIIFHKGRAEYDEAEQLISRTSQKLLGFDMGLLRRLSDEGIIALLQRPDISDVGAFLVAAELLREQGEIDKARGAPDAGYDSFLKALSLYLEYCIGAPEICTEEIAAKIASSLEEVSMYHVPGTAQRKLAAYYEQRGDFARAENVIHHMLENGDPRAAAAGEAFYARLRGKSDAELTLGGLPRAEMEEGALAFEELQAEE